MTIVATAKQKKPAKATVVNFGVSLFHLKLTENIEKPIEDVKPNISPSKDFFALWLLQHLFIIMICHFYLQVIIVRYFHYMEP